MARASIEVDHFGIITMTARKGAVVALDFGVPAVTDFHVELDDETDFVVLDRAISALKVYFGGGEAAFDFPLEPAGTEYQRRVWAAERRIPRGQIRSYGEMARIAGGSARSIGGANRANPIPILIPCHRVCAAHGIGGYAGSDREGWELATKRRLLRLEGASAPE